MTKVAHDCAQLGIPVDTWRIYSGDDPLYLVWLSVVVDRVNSTNRANQSKKGR